MNSRTFSFCSRQGSRKVCQKCISPLASTNFIISLLYTASLINFWLFGRYVKGEWYCLFNCIDRHNVNWTKKESLYLLSRISCKAKFVFTELNYTGIHRSQAGTPSKCFHQILAVTRVLVNAAPLQWHKYGLEVVGMAMAHSLLPGGPLHIPALHPGLYQFLLSDSSLATHYPKFDGTQE